MAPPKKSAAKKLSEEEEFAAMIGTCSFEETHDDALLKELAEMMGNAGLSDTLPKATKQTATRDRLAMPMDHLMDDFDVDSAQIDEDDLCDPDLLAELSALTGVDLGEGQAGDEQDPHNQYDDDEVAAMYDDVLDHGIEQEEIQDTMTRALASDTHDDDAMAERGEPAGFYPGQVLEPTLAPAAATGADHEQPLVEESATVEEEQEEEEDSLPLEYKLKTTDLNLLQKYIQLEKVKAVMKKRAGDIEGARQSLLASKQLQARLTTLQSSQSAGASDGALSTAAPASPVKAAPSQTPSSLQQQSPPPLVQAKRASLKADIPNASPQMVAQLKSEALQAKRSGNIKLAQTILAKAIQMEEQLKRRPSIVSSPQPATAATATTATSSSLSSSSSAAAVSSSTIATTAVVTPFVDLAKAGEGLAASAVPPQKQPSSIAPSSLSSTFGDTDSSTSTLSTDNSTIITLSSSHDARAEQLSPPPEGGSPSFSYREILEKLQHQRNACVQAYTYYTSMPGGASIAAAYAQKKRAFDADLRSLQAQIKSRIPKPPRCILVSVEYEMGAPAQTAKIAEDEMHIQLGNLVFEERHKLKAINPAADTLAFQCTFEWPPQPASASAHVQCSESFKAADIEAANIKAPVIYSGIKRDAKMVKFVEHKKIRIELVRQESFLFRKKWVPLGACAQVRLDNLVESCDHRETVQLLDAGRRPTNVSIDVHLALSAPLVKAEPTVQKETWIVIEEYNNGTAALFGSAVAKSASSSVATISTAGSSKSPEPAASSGKAKAAAPPTTASKDDGDDIGASDDDGHDAKVKEYLDNIQSYLVIEHELTQIEANPKCNSDPDLLARKLGLETKRDQFTLRVELGQITADEYLDQVRRAIATQKQRALQSKRSGDMATARLCLSHVHIMEKELAEAAAEAEE